MQRLQEYRPTAILMICIVILILTLMSRTAIGQTGDVEPTIEALQTRVAEQEATIASLTQSAGSDSQHGAQTEVEASGESPNSMIPIVVGSQIGTSAWAMTVQHVDQRKNIDVHQGYSTNGVYLEVTLQVNNLTIVPISFPYHQLVVRDADNRTYKHHSDITSGLIDERYEPLASWSLLQPDIPYETVVVFEISGSSASPTLIMTGVTGDESSYAERNATTAKEHALQVGSLVQYGGWHFRVDAVNIQESATSIFGTHTPKGKYFVLDITITNTSSNPTPFPYRDMRIVDGLDRWFSVDRTPTEGMAYDLTGVQHLDPFPPNIPFQTGLVFDLPANADGLVLVASFDNPEFSVKLQSGE